jgi:phosphodiesterase/alkaline phosphatase D-like protein
VASCIVTENEKGARLSRRTFLGGVGVTATGLAVASGPVIWQQPARADAPSAQQVHLTFGASPASEVAVSRATPASVSRPRVVLGTAHHGFGRVVPAETRGYTDANNGIETITHHARIDGPRPDTDYVFQVVSDGATPTPPTRGASASSTWTRAGSRATRPR